LAIDSFIQDSCATLATVTIASLANWTQCTGFACRRHDRCPFAHRDIRHIPLAALSAVYSHAKAIPRGSMIFRLPAVFCSANSQDASFDGRLNWHFE
jgi:hypothetical protein